MTQLETDAIVSISSTLSIVGSLCILYQASEQYRKKGELAPGRKLLVWLSIADIGEPPSAS
jgi:hypothetical protein